MIMVMVMVMIMIMLVSVIISIIMMLSTISAIFISMRVIISKALLLPCSLQMSS